MFSPRIHQTFGHQFTVVSSQLVAIKVPKGNLDFLLRVIKPSSSTIFIRKCFLKLQQRSIRLRSKMGQKEANISKKLWDKIILFGKVYDKDRLKGIFIEVLKKSLI